MDGASIMRPSPPNTPLLVGARLLAGRLERRLPERVRGEPVLVVRHDRRLEPATDVAEVVGAQFLTSGRHRGHVRRRLPVRHALTYQQRCERLRRCSTSPNSTSMAASSAADGIVHREGPSSRTRKSSQVSPGYRSQCRLRTGAASAKCRAGTGARVSPSYRNLTCRYRFGWSGRRDSNPRPSAWEASGLGGRSGAELGQERGDLGAVRSRGRLRRLPDYASGLVSIRSAGE